MAEGLIHSSSSEGTIKKSRLAFLTDDALTGHNPHFFRQQLQRLGLKISSVDQPSPSGSFWQRSCLVHCGDLVLMACAHTAVCLDLLNDDDGVMLIIAYGGKAEVSCHGHTFSLRSSTEMAYLPGGNLQINSADFNCVLLRLDRLRLQGKVESRIGAHTSIGQLRSELRIPRVFAEGNPLTAALVLQLRRTVEMMDSPCLQGSGVLEVLQLDQLIYRIVAELISSENQGHDPATADAANDRQTPMRDQILEELIAWILANLHRPIGLEELEQHSAYSRRSLQYTFKRRFGCSPMHWIRHQRLQQALDQLQHPEADTSVRTVAQACGYTHLSAFGRDFRNRFDRRASDVLRQARQLQGAEERLPPSLQPPAVAPSA